MNRKMIRLARAAKCGSWALVRLLAIGSAASADHASHPKPQAAL
jgi:hypothetical protein